MTAALIAVSIAPFAPLVGEAARCRDWVAAIGYASIPLTTLAIALVVTIFN